MKLASLNHTYRLIWNATRQAWMVVSELTKSQGKSKAIKLALSLTGVVFTGYSLAEPTGGVVTGGSGTISQNGAVTTIHQSSSVLNLNWNTFNIAPHESVNFIQPSSTALAVNQILDTNGSRILGNLNANGRVWLINPNGVFFGAGSQVNVGALLASTLNPLSQTSDANQVFGNGGTGSIINQGTINAANGGYVAFVGNTVSNQGSIVANGGTVAFGAGSQVTLTFADNGLYKINVDQSTLNNLAENKKLIQANGGTVLLSAGAKQSLLNSIVNNEGIIEAQSIENQAGKIVLLAGMAAGKTTVSGTLDASAKTGNGGFIETSGAKVSIADSANITTKAQNTDKGNGKNGKWLIDPHDFTIAKRESDGDITGATLSAALQNNDVTIETQNNAVSCTGASCDPGTPNANGDIFVNDTITWNSNSDLTLSAYRNININRSITATGANAKLNLKYGQGHGDGIIDGKQATYNVNARVNLHEGDNFSTQLGINGNVIEYKVITRLGSLTSSNDGTLQGINGALNGNYVLGADIDATETSNWTDREGSGFRPLGNIWEGSFSGKFDGLGHVIKKLTINREALYGGVGLFGATDRLALVQNVGLVNADIRGPGSVGGLVGINFGKIFGSFVTGTVQAASCCVSGSPSENPEDYGGVGVGGLVGENGGEIKNSYFNGEVKGFDEVGGLVGVNSANSTNFVTYGGKIENSYADSTVTMLKGTTGTFVNAPNKGGLVGLNVGQFVEVLNNDPVVVNSFYTFKNQSDYDDITFTNIGTRKTAHEMQQRSTFTDANWDIDAQGGTGKVWRIYQDHTSPLLRSFMTYADLGTTQTTYNGQTQTSDSVKDPFNANPNIEPIKGNGASGKNAATYTNSGFYSTQLGYDLTGGDLQVTPKVLNLSGTRSYDGTKTIADGVLAIDSTDLIGTETLVLSGSGTVGSPNASATAQTVTSVNYALANGTGLASNYTLTGGSKTVTITPKNVSFTASATDKVYNGNANALASLSTTDFIDGDGTTLEFDSATFASKDVAYDSNNNVTSQTVTLNGVKLGGSGTGNYNLLIEGSNATTSAKITPKVLNLSGTRSYDGTKTIANGVLKIDAGQLIGNETLDLSGSGTVTSKDASTTPQNLATSNYTLSTLASGGNGGLAGNYTLGTKTVTINKADAKVVVTGYNTTYNGQNHTATYTLEGVNGETGADVGNVDVSGTTHKNANTYNDKWAFKGSQNYNDIGPTDVTNVIEKAELTYLADKVTIQQGQTPNLTGVVTGFVEGENFASVFGNQDTQWASPEYKNKNLPGIYEVQGGGLEAVNYRFVQAAQNKTALTVLDAPVSSPDLTNPVSNTQQPNLPSNNAPPQTTPPYQQVDLNITPASGQGVEDDTLYDVIQTYGCSV